jgi:hypothetical protein
VSGGIGTETASSGVGDGDGLERDAVTDGWDELEVDAGVGCVGVAVSLGDAVSPLSVHAAATTTHATTRAWKGRRRTIDRRC